MADPPRDVLVLQAATTMLGATSALEGAVDAAVGPRLDVRVLEALVRLDCSATGRRTISDLTALELTSRTASTRLVDRLQGAGYATRRSVETSRRITQVVLTDAGRQALGDAGPSWSRALGQTAAPAEDRAALVAVMRLLLEAHGARAAAFGIQLLDDDRALRASLRAVLGRRHALGLAALLQSRCAAVVGGALEADLREGTGLPPARFELLAVLAGSADGTLTMTEIARLAVATKSGISRLIDRMASDGLVRRAPSLDDRRVVHVALTPRGVELHRRSRATWDGALRRHLGAHLTREQLRLVVQVLRPLRDARDAA